MKQWDPPAVVGRGLCAISLKSMFPGVAPLPSKCVKAVGACDAKDALVCGVAVAPVQPLQEVMFGPLRHSPDHVDPLDNSVRDAGWLGEDGARISRRGQ